MKTLQSNNNVVLDVVLLLIYSLIDDVLFISNKKLKFKLMQGYIIFQFKRMDKCIGLYI